MFRKRWFIKKYASIPLVSITSYFVQFVFACQFSTLWWCYTMCLLDGTEHQWRNTHSKKHPEAKTRYTNYRFSCFFLVHLYRGIPFLQSATPTYTVTRNDTTYLDVWWQVHSYVYLEFSTKGTLAEKVDLSTITVMWIMLIKFILHYFILVVHEKGIKNATSGL